MRSEFVARSFPIPGPNDGWVEVPDWQTEYMNPDSVSPSLVGNSGLSILEARLFDDDNQPIKLNEAPLQRMYIRSVQFGTSWSLDQYQWGLAGMWFNPATQERYVIIMFSTTENETPPEFLGV